MRKTTNAPKTTTALPKGVTARDLTRPHYDDPDYPKNVDYDRRSFDLWLISSFGWVIPTLAIARAGQRTYAVALGEGNTGRSIAKGAQVRVGLGPHVLAQHTVYVRTSRADALQPFFDLREQGAVTAHTTRDRISSRRAQGAVERANGNRYWRWDV